MYTPLARIILYPLRDAAKFGFSYQNLLALSTGKPGNNMSHLDLHGVLLDTGPSG
jgi:hypothetical protein